MTPQDNTADNSFKGRLKATKTTRWIRFAIVSAIFVAWVAWMQSWWLLIFWFLLFDIYITVYIPLTWWKKSKSKTTRTVMSWIDAIVYALVLVYFVFAFVGQNYQIPSSSLEKTLLTGDYLWVNKMVYGPRVPMTPVHFPLVHNKLLGMKSYLDNPSNPYRRLKGLRSVAEGDIVVFNFPAGDTVMSRYEDSSPEYYDMLVERYGRHVLEANPAEFGEKVFRPVDRRQNYVKRAVGLPGQRIRISNDTIFIDGRMRPFPKNVQFNYLFSTDRPLADDDIRRLDITPSDLAPISQASAEFAMWRQLLPGAPAGSYLYVAPLTESMLGTLHSDYGAHSVKLNSFGNSPKFIFPYSDSGDWTISNFGGADGLLIPAKGTTIALTPDNWMRYHRAIRNYEGHTDSWLDPITGTVYIDGARPPNTPSPWTITS